MFKYYTQDKAENEQSRGYKLNTLHGNRRI